MAKRKTIENAREPEPETEAIQEETQDLIPEVEVHPNIDANTPHVDPTGAADFDRPYDQWSNDDLKVRAKQLGVVGVIGHGPLIDAIRESEHKLEDREAETADAS